MAAGAPIKTPQIPSFTLLSIKHPPIPYLIFTTLEISHFTCADGNFRVLRPCVLSSVRPVQELRMDVVMVPIQ